MKGLIYLLTVAVLLLAGALPAFAADRLMPSQQALEAVPPDVLLVAADDDALLDPYGTPAAWSVQAAGSSPYLLPHGGSAMAEFNSEVAIHGRRLVAGPLDLSAVTSPQVSFWMSHDSQWPRSQSGTYDDSLQVQVSTDGTNWTNAGSRLLRFDATCNPGYSNGCWTQHTIDLPDGYSVNSVYIGFLGTGFLGNNIYLDDITLPGGTAEGFEGTSFPPAGWTQQGPVNTSPIQRMLQEFGDLGAVDVFDAVNGTPSPSQLQAYDVVVTWSARYPYFNPTALGDVLADYVDAGGKVINLRQSMDHSDPSIPSLNALAGRFVTASPPYVALWGATSGVATWCFSGTIEHPIMSGVTQVCDDITQGVAVTPGSSTVANWYQDEWATIAFVAAKDDHSVVSINGYVGYWYSWTGYTSDGVLHFTDQMDNVLHNAILWVLTPPPPGYDISGTVFDDQNANGAYDTGEPGLPGVAVGLDKGCNQTVDASANTGSDGSYAFLDQASGLSYCVWAAAPTGYTVTLYPSNTESLSADTTGVNIGFTSLPLFSWTPTTPDEGASATFTAVAGWTAYGWKVGQPGSDCAAWDWGAEDATGQVADLSFGVSGQYQVCLRMWNAAGYPFYSGQTVTVANLAPAPMEAGVDPEPSTAGEPLLDAWAAFIDVDHLASCTVDYGDGSGAQTGTIPAEENACEGPAHTYTVPGTYTVIFTATDPDGVQGSTSVEHVVAPKVVAADLSITKTDSKDPTSRGARLTYTLVVTNLGPDTAEGAKVVDTLDTHTTYTSISKPKGWTCSQAAGVVTCTAASLGNGKTATIKITVTVLKSTPVGTTLLNRAEVSSNTNDPVTTNNSVTQETRVAK